MPVNGQLRAVMRHLRRAVAPTATGLTDEQLLARFLDARDEAAFELLLRRHEKMVHGLLQRVLRDSHAIDDAFQATFMTFARKARTIAKGARLGAWLHRVALRAALRSRQRTAMRAHREKLVETLPETPTPDVLLEELSWRELRPVLDDELNRLPEKYRTPLILCYLEGKTYKAVAEELGSSLGTVSTLLTRGRAILRTRLAKRGVELSATLLAMLLGKATVSGAGAALVQVTVQSAILFASGAATAAIPAEVLTLTHGVIKTMFLAKLKTAVSVVTGIACTALVAGALIQGFAVAQPGTGHGAGTDSSGKRAEQQAAQGEWREVRVIQVPGPSGPKPVWSLAISPDGQSLAAVAEKTIRIWDVATGKEADTGPFGHNGAVLSVRFSPDGKQLASGDKEGSVWIWTTPRDSVWVRARRNVPRQAAGIESVAFSPDGKLLASCGQETDIRIWDLQTGKELRALPQQRIQHVSFSPDGSVLLSSATDGAVRLWDTATGKAVWHDQSHQGPTHAAFSPDGKFIVSAGNEGTVRLWEASTAKLLFIYKAGQALSTLAVSPDGKSIAVAGAGPTITILDARTGKVMAQLKTHATQVHSVIFTPDGRQLLTGDKEGNIRIWQPVEGPVRVGQTLYTSAVKPAGDRLDELVKQLAASQRTEEQLVEALYLATIARFPTEIEAQTARKHLAQKKDRPEALQDLLFALTNTKEFMTNLDELNKRNPWRVLKQEKPK